MKENNIEFNLKELLEFLLTKIWLIVVCAIIGCACGYFYANTRKVTTYSYSTSLFVQSISADGSTSNVSISKQRVPLYMEIIANNRDFHQEILENLTPEERAKFGFSKDDTAHLASLKKMASLLRTEQSGELEMFYVHVTAGSEECAKRISEIITDISTRPEKENAVYKNIGAPSHIKCVDSPRSNGSVTYNNIKIGLLVGFAGGVFLAVFAVFIYFVLMNRASTRKFLEANYEIPILGAIPCATAESKVNRGWLKSVGRREQ